MPKGVKAKGNAQWQALAFLTLRMSFTALVFAACGPPLAIVAEISSLYILQEVSDNIVCSCCKKLLYPSHILIVVQHQAQLNAHTADNKEASSSCTSIRERSKQHAGRGKRKWQGSQTVGSGRTCTR